MRVLVLLRGAPGCGKSTWIEGNGLKQYSLSADELRLMCQCPVLQVDGSYGISQANDKLVWNLLFQMLEARMERGEFTVIDATNSKTAEMNRYKQLADTYRFRMYCVDFTDIPIDECKRRNHLRPDHKVVPDDVIDKMYSRFATQKIPSGIKVIKPDELDQIWFKPIDLSKYKAVHHIGDIHGCATVLKQYLKEGIHEDEFYIFCGDYIDRGMENVETIRFLFELADLPNVLLLEGNHERWLWAWAHGVKSKSQEFEKYTRHELEDAGIDPKQIRKFYRKLGQCAYYTYNHNIVLVTHGGLSCIPDNLTKVATEQMIRGVGQYSDYENVAKCFDDMTGDCVYQIFGHRNTKASPIELSARCFDLEGQVEFGGYLRTIMLDGDGWHAEAIKNDVFRPPVMEEAAVKGSEKNTTVAELVNEMRHSRLVQEKRFGNISSFNFTRDAFYNKQWNAQTTKARGLFINTDTNMVVARAYEKFFNINEREETKMPILQHRFQFPVVAYRKENGFLGIVSYNSETDDFFISSKSTPDGPYSKWFADLFLSATRDKDAVKSYLRENGVSMVFECIDIVHDPHIIKYDQNHVVLLDIVKNQLEFSKLPYDQLTHVGNQFGYQVKELAACINDWPEFCRWYDEVEAEDYTYDGKEIEGFVIEDSAGFMVKLKLSYYNNWKFLRGVANETLKTGNFRRTAALVTPLQNQFFGYLKSLGINPDMKTDIISLRDKFYETAINGRIQ